MLHAGGHGRYHHALHGGGQRGRRGRYGKYLHQCVYHYVSCGVVWHDRRDDTVYRGKAYRHRLSGKTAWRRVQRSAWLWALHLSVCIFWENTGDCGCGAAVDGICQDLSENCRRMLLSECADSDFFQLSARFWLHQAAAHRDACGKWGKLRFKRGLFVWTARRCGWRGVGDGSVENPESWDCDCGIKASGQGKRGPGALKKQRSFCPNN